jgi:anhydro-N-acetylmuramic acid kinase
MSGTSLDGIDAVIVDFAASHFERPKLIAFHKKELPAILRKKILSLCQPGNNEINQMVDLDIELGELFATATLELLAASGVDSTNIIAIGSHGQTIRHHSDTTARHFSLQIGDPNTISFRTGITTVADFRRMDIAASGQGAPLVPAFHHAVLASDDTNRVIVNIGGMTNITLLARDTPIIGFDTGPGNVLMDAWNQQHHQTPWDQNGDWAAQGQVQASLLTKWLAHPFFTQAAPKSTGRETFNLEWALSLADDNEKQNPANMQRTLLELTAVSLTDCIKQLTVPVAEILICGGGCHNLLLRQRIAELLPLCNIGDTNAEGIDPDWMEAIAFAWLAKQRIEKKFGNLPTVTGALSNCILGGVYEPPKH